LILYAGNTLIAMAKLAFPDEKKRVSTTKLQALAAEAGDDIWKAAGIDEKFWPLLRQLNEVGDSDICKLC
jgi:hypothetical protein